MNIKIRSFLLRYEKSKAFVLLLNIIFTLLYFVIAHQSLKLATISSSASPVWPPTGFAILVLFLFGRNYLPSILIGAIAANFFGGSPWHVSLIIALGNTLEAFAAVWLYKKVFEFESKLEHLTMLAATAVAAIIGPVFSASIGVGCLNYFNILPNDLVTSTWATWWIGDVVGALLIFPLGLSLLSEDFKDFISFFKSSFLTSFTKLFVGFTAISICCYILSDSQALKFLFLVFPALLACSFLESALFIYLSGFSICGIFISLTILGKGPFTLSDLNQNLINIEIFLVSVAITTLALVSFTKVGMKRTIRAMLLTGWIFWGVIFYNIEQNHQALDEHELADSAGDMNFKIEKRMETYIDILKGGVGLFNATESVGPTVWNNYINTIDVFENYPGIRGLGVVFKTSDLQIPRFQKKYSQILGSDFKIKLIPENEKLSDHYVITYLEPKLSNQEAIGLDIASEPIRKRAADMAMTTGKATISDRITLVQDQKKRNGFLLMLPVYQQNKTKKNAKERIAAFSNWVYAPFVSETFFNSVFAHFEKPIVLEIFDNHEMIESNRIYLSSEKPINKKAQSFISELVLGQKTFYLKWSKSVLAAASNDFISTWIGLIGSLSVILIVCFIVNINLLQVKANALAEGLNKDFMNSQKLIQEQKAKIIETSKMASLGEMASGIAHEINNPMSIISARAQQLEKVLKTENYPDQKNKAIESARIIVATVSRVSKIIKGLRQFAREGEHDPMQLVTIQTIVDDSLVLCSERFKFHFVELRLRLDYQGEIFCRDTQITQVLLNLLNNAFDAVSDSPERWVELSTKLNQNYIEICVTDSGPGIPVELREKILLPFFTTKEVGKGTGLGLSISKGILESHHGELTLDTNYRQTRFVMKIPNHLSQSRAGKVA